MVAFIDQMRGRGYRVETICQVLRDYGIKIAARTYRAFKARGPSTREIEDTRILALMIHLREDIDERGRLPRERFYGRRKMTHLLRRYGEMVSEGKVGRLMRLGHMQGLRRGKAPKTTTRGPKPAAGDLLERRFWAVAPNRAWVMDITYVRATALGWCYTVLITDLYGQKIVAWHVADNLTDQIVKDALTIALWNRRHQGHPVAAGQLIHHSDHGSQMTSIAFGEQLANAGITPSFGSVGDALDNATAEAVNSLYKAECVRSDGPFTTLDDVISATAGWVDWYNTSRLHSTLGYATPDEIESAYYDQTNAA